MFSYKRVLLVVVILCAWLLAVAPAAAQETPLRLGLSRVWGYSSGANIQGNFTANVSGPQNLSSVTFLIDGQEVASSTTAPFRFAFATGSYPLGKHTLTAKASTSDGQTLQSNVLTVNMVTTAQAGQSILPILGVLLLVTLVGTVGSAWLANRGKSRAGERGQTRNYGFAGGTICPRCERPFALPAFALNIPPGKLTRCPYCGKWGVFRRARPEALAAAEAREAAGAQPAVPEMSEEEKLRRQVQESRYR